MFSHAASWPYLKWLSLKSLQLFQLGNTFFAYNSYFLHKHNLNILNQHCVYFSRDNNLMLYPCELCGELFYLEIFRSPLKSIFVSVMHQYRQTKGWCAFLLVQRAHGLHSRREKPSKNIQKHCPILWAQVLTSKVLISQRINRKWPLTKVKGQVELGSSFRCCCEHVYPFQARFYGIHSVQFKEWNERSVFVAEPAKEKQN